MKSIAADELFDNLHRAGVFEDDPKMVRRVVIDLEHGSVARVYVERFLDVERLIVGIASAGITVETPK